MQLAISKTRVLCNSVRTRKKRKFKVAISCILYLILALIHSSVGKAVSVVDSDSVSADGEQEGLGENDGGTSNETIKSVNFPKDFFTLEQRQNGAIIIHFAVSFYLFYGLYLICDEYFVPSVESICRELKISSDVAGATFMAASTSAPELFTNFIGTFITKGDLGVGTIVGSAVLNVLAVASICGIGAAFARGGFTTQDGKRGVTLEWWPLTRDSFFFLFSIGALMIVLLDQRVDWYEALAMIALYAIYVAVLWKNVRIKGFLEKCAEGFKRRINGEAGKKRHKVSIYKAHKPVVTDISEITPLLVTESDGQIKPAKIDGDPQSSGDEDELSVSSNEYDEVMISNALLKSTSHWEEESTWGVFNAPKEAGAMEWVEWLVSWPIRFAYAGTIPDCRLPMYRKWYPVTLVMCVIWTGALSYVLSWMMTVIGETLSIPESVTGLTFLAIGTSLPEIFSSVIVAKQGLGSMALSNSVGSNTFDILMCLGLPWLMETILLIGKPINYIEIQSSGLEYSTMLMVATIVILYILLACNGFLLDKRIGIVSLIIYVVFITLAILVEMRVFGNGGS